MKVVHVARIQLNYESGMGRVASMWKDALEGAGHEFVHIGVDEVSYAHPLLWGFQAQKYFKKLSINPDVVLVHEPYSGFFVEKRYKKIVFSHGVEERAWLVQSFYKLINQNSIKSKLLPIKLRFLSNNIGFKKADLIFVLNEEDRNFLLQKGIDNSKIKIIQNGYYRFSDKNIESYPSPVFLFNGTWIGRKGNGLLISVFNKILIKYPDVKLLIAGTNDKNSSFIKTEFSENVRTQVTLIPKFKAEEEELLYRQANFFVLPSYYEGQSLALTQAMAMGLCPIVANNCGQADFVQHRENGLLFETGNEYEFEKMIDYVINHQSIANLMALKAKKSVEKHTWENVSKNILEQIVNIK